MIQHGDILLRDGSIYGVAGDLANGDNQEQAIGAIVNANSGNFRKHPTLAANLSMQLNGPLNSREVAASVQDSLFSDGWRVDKINIEVDSLQDITVTVMEAEKITDNTKSLI